MRETGIPVRRMNFCGTQIGTQIDMNFAKHNRVLKLACMQAASPKGNTTHGGCGTSIGPDVPKWVRKVNFGARMLKVPKKTAV